MDWWDKFPGRETEEDARRKVVLADAVTELEVLVEHGTESKRDGLLFVSGLLDKAKRSERRVLL